MRLASNVKLLSEFPSGYVAFFIFIVRGVAGQLITMSPPFKFVGETITKEPSSGEKIHNAPSLQEIMPAQQPIRARVLL